MNKIKKHSRLHDLIMEVLRNNAELYEEIKITLNEEATPVASLNGFSSVEVETEEDEIKEIDAILKTNFARFDDVFRALA